MSGQSLSDLVVQMYNEFTELANAFQSRGDDPLYTTNTVSSTPPPPTPHGISQNNYAALHMYYDIF